MKNDNSDLKLFKVIDMMLTAHSSLRDKYSSYALLMDLALFGISIVLNATVFLDPKILRIIGLDEDKTKLILGVFSILTFIATFVSLRVDWKQKSEQYRQTAETLAKLKSLLNENQYSRQDENNSVIITIHQIKEELDKLPVKIPEKEFIRLKALHKRKMELSKMIDENPGASIFLIKLKFCWLSNKNIFQRQNHSESRSESV